MLYIVSTPIGNLEDITLRALRILKEVDYIVCEDTRKILKLLKRYSLKKPLVSFHNYNERSRTRKVIEDLKQGKAIALVSEAGTPTIADPGYYLIRECRKHNLALTILPGPCSIVSALTLSSLPHNEFFFCGFLPKKEKVREQYLKNIASYSCAIVIFAPPHSLLKILNEIRKNMGNRKITVARELTKKFEEVREGEVDKEIEYFSKKKPKGEFVLIVEGLK